MVGSRRIDAARARREAKALLAAARRGDPPALAEFRADRSPLLADAQHAIARRHGFTNWSGLVRTATDPGAALRFAAGEGDEDTVYALLDSGAPPNAIDPESGRTALHLAAVADRLEVVGVLVGWRHVDQLARDRENKLALDLAPAGSPTAAVLASCHPGRGERPLGDRHASRALQAEIAMLDHLSRAPGVHRRPIGDGFVFRTGLFDNSRNGVVCSQLVTAVDVAAIADEFSDVPASWFVPDVSGSTEMGAALKANGAHEERTAVHMAAPLAPFADARDPRVVEVTRAGDLVHLDREQAALLAASGAPFRHFVIEGTAGVTTFAAGSTLIGVELWVAGRARRRGLGAALVGHAAAVGAGDGCSVAVLAPTPATVPFYERLGFALERSLPGQRFYLPTGDEPG